jgi:hypothetical protein
MVFGGLSGSGVVLLVLACAGALALLHFLRIRPREVRVVTTLFWAEAAEWARARSLWRRLRHPWTYVLLLLICILLALALGEPEPGEGSLSRVWQVLVIDAGASMCAPSGEGDKSWLEAALEAALDEGNRLSWRDRLAVIAVDPLPRLVHRFGEPIELARRRLNAIMPCEAPALLDAGLDLAASLLHGRENARVTLIAGGAVHWSPRQDPGQIELRVVRVGERARNAALLDAVFLSDEANPLRGRLLVRAGYWADAATEITVLVQGEGGQPIHQEAATLQPGGTHDFVVDDLDADGSHLFLRLLPKDSVPADNEMELDLPYRRAIRVRAVDDLAIALRAYLENAPAVVLVDSDAEADIDVTTDSHLDTGNPVIEVVTEGPAVAAGSIVGIVDTQLALRMGSQSPLTCGAGAALDDVKEPGRILLASGRAILAAQSEGPGRSCLRLSSALLSPDSEFCRHPEFAVFLSCCLQQLAGRRPYPPAVPARRRAEDPAWLTRLGADDVANVMPGDRESSDLWQLPAQGDGASPPRAWRGALAPFEWLLLAAVVLLVVQGVLHSRGRIP